MSRGFVKEGDQEEVPIVAPRAHLPEGVANYVTPAGLEALNNERAALLSERDALKAQTDRDHRVQINYLNAKLELLEARVHTAQVVDLAHQPKDKVLFGAKVTLYKNAENAVSTYQIVGVDEASILENKISFLSPLAKILLNKKVGENIVLHTPKGDNRMEIKSIEY